MREGYGLFDISVNKSRPGENGNYFADDILKFIFLKENLFILKKKFIDFFSSGPINNSPALVQIMATRRRGDKPLSEPKMV